MSSTAQKGFTLAELLIALALLGVIAAFTIPKIFNAAGNNRTVATLRETVSTLEQSYSDLRTQGIVPTAGTLFAAILPQINATSSGAAANGFVAPHPCAVAPVAALTGFIQLANGAMVTGLSGGGALRAAAPVPAEGAQINTIVCIDVDGAGSGPNAVGQDIFVGNFNQFGDFDGTSATAPAGVSPNYNGRVWNWGSFGPGVNGVMTSAAAAAQLGAPFNVAAAWTNSQL